MHVYYGICFIHRFVVVLVINLSSGFSTLASSGFSTLVTTSVFTWSTDN